MTKVKFLNLLQITKIEIEYGISKESNPNILTNKLLEFANNGKSQCLRAIFKEYDDYIMNLIKTKEEFTKEEMFAILKEMRIC